MGFVYLIGEYDHDHRYKIGSTRNHNIEKRLRQLQTGNSSELFIKSFFETDKPFRLEKMLHMKYDATHLVGEWFVMDDSEVFEFERNCMKYQDIIDSLKENPYY